MSREFDGRLEATVEQLDRMTGELLDEESGSLSQAFSAFRTQLDDMLGQTFDPDSKTSVLSAFERIFSDAAQRQLDSFRRVIDPNDADSPMGQHRAEIVKTVKETEDRLAKALADVSEKIAVTKAQAELIDKTATKGFSFEELVHRTVSRLAGAHADIAEHVGSTSGVAGSKAGDEVVTLCLDDTRGATARMCSSSRTANSA